MNTPPESALRLLRRLAHPQKREELEADLREAFAAWCRAGSPTAARRRVWREVLLVPFWRLLGSWLRLRDNSPRGPRGGDGGAGGRPGSPPPLHDGSGDLRYALRRMVRDPGTTLMAILILAVGVGGNATIFTLARNLFSAPPPLVSNPHELVGLDGGSGGRSIPEFGYYDYEFFRTRSEAFRDILAYGGFPGTRGRTPKSGGEVSVGGTDARIQAAAWVVTSNYFRLLGVPAALGSGFTGTVGERPRGGPEVVLSHGFWARAFGSDPGVLDRPLNLNGIPFRVVGITPRPSGESTPPTSRRTSTSPSGPPASSPPVSTTPSGGTARTGASGPPGT